MMVDQLHSRDPEGASYNETPCIGLEHPFVLNEDHCMTMLQTQVWWYGAIMLCQIAHDTLIGSHDGNLSPGSDECIYIPASPVEFLQFCPSTRDFTRTLKS